MRYEKLTIRRYSFKLDTAAAAATVQNYPYIMFP